jgi:PAS domain S-box-containing protein
VTQLEKLSQSGIDVTPFIESIEDYAIVVLDLVGRVCTWNRGARCIKGYERDEILGRSFEVFYPEEDLRAGKPARALVEAARVGRHEDEGWRIRKNGSRFWANVVITTRRDERGELVGFVEVARDLTQRRATAQRLCEEQAARAAAETLAQRLTVLRSITEASLCCSKLGLRGLLDAVLVRIQDHVGVHMVAVWLRDATGDRLTCAASRGLSPPVEDDARVRVARRIAGRVATTRTPLVVSDLAAADLLELDAPMPARSEQLQSFAGVPLFAHGTLLGVLEVGTREERSFSDADVSLLRLVADVVAAAVQRARVHGALTESERRFRATFELAPLGIAQTALDGRFLRVNGALCKMLGYSAEELSTTNFQNITHPDDVPHNLVALARLVAGHIEKYTMEKRYLRRDGGVFWIQVTVSLVRDDDGRPAYLIAIIEDICQRMRAHEERERLLGELRVALSTRDRFLSIASHELRTPLTTLMLQVERLGSAQPTADHALPPALATRVAMMTRQVDRLSALVEQLLDVARIHEGRLELHLEEVDLGALVLEVVERFEEQAARAKTPIEVRIDKPVAGCWDRLRLDQVLTNLVSNAVKYGRNGRIAITAAADDSFASVVVADRGIGIRPEDRGRLFGRFERLASDPAIGGIGLGLWITREIVEALGGTIGVESELGEGSTFVVTLPRDGPTNVARAPHAAA